MLDWTQMMAFRSNKVKKAAFLMGLLFLWLAEGPSEGGPERYGCERVWPGTITIDGELNEAAWRVADKVQLVDSRTGEKPNQATEAKLLWDTGYLYLAFACEDSDVWSTLTQRDDPVYTEEAVEVFIAPHGSEAAYYEFDVNPLGALFDTRIVDKSLLGVQTVRWKKTYSSGAKSAAKVEGTINDSRDVDEGWTVEMAIPLTDLVGPEEHLPQPGDVWRVNLCRVDWPAGAKEQELMAWSATGASFHQPDEFGELEFRETFLYRCRHIKEGPIVVDGALVVAEWQKAEPVGRFRLTRTGTYAQRQTVAKMLWDDKNLYLGFECEDDDVWATMKVRDEDLWQEDVVEAFIAPPLAVGSYFEFELNPLNALLDMVVVNPPGSPMDQVYFNKRYDARGLISAVKVDGTVDNRDDVDKGWTVEVAIPFVDLVTDGRGAPSPGDVWRMGLYRGEVGKEGADSEYSAWSPTGSWFHIPGQFGAVAFVEER